MSIAAAHLTVARVAERAGVSRDTVRFYEHEGLLPAPARTSAGYRAYDESTIERLQFIQGTKRLGLTLADIRDLLAVRDTGVCPCEPAEEHLQRRLAEVDAHIAELTRLREQMTSMLAAIPTGDCPPPEPGSWCPPSGDEVCAVHDAASASSDDCGCDAEAVPTAERPTEQRPTPERG